MYAQLRRGLPAIAAPKTEATWLTWPRVSRNVVNLGLTSLFTDISSEMVSTILPLYLVFFLKFTPIQFGMLDGLYQGGASLIRVLGGAAADRSQRHKEVAAIGYALSAISKVGLLLGSSGGPLTIAGALFIDRTGKGIRTAPRDALISLSSPQSSLGTSFAVHRTLDTAGAMLGPLVAFGLLALIPDGFDVIFVTSLCVALIGLGILVLFVQNRQATATTSVKPKIRLNELLKLPRFKYVVLAAAGLGVATISDGFLFLTLQHRLTFAASFIPLLYVATSTVYFLLALPMGRLADRVGRGRVFVAGYALLLATYVVLLTPAPGAMALAVTVGLFGTYYATTDGVLMALASSLLPADVRASGIAVLTAAIGLGSVAASIIFGGVWTFAGPEVAVTVFAVALLAALGLTILTLLKTRNAADAT